MLSEPSFSSDGKRIAFSARRANIKEDAYDSDVYIADVPQGKVARFTTGKKDSDPKFSPDGSSILFASRRNLKKEDKGNTLYVISSEGGEARLLKRSEDGIDNPQWAADSKSIYFMSFVEKKTKDDVKVIRRMTFWFNGLGFVYNRRKHIFRAKVDSGEFSQITNGSFDVVDFAISGDGSKVAYLASTDDIRPYIADLFVMSATGKHRKKITRSNMEISALTWSPNGQQIAILGDDLPSGFASHSRVWVADPRSRKVVCIDQVDRNKANALNSDARAKAHGPGNLIWDSEGIYYLQADGGSVHLYRMKVGEKPRMVVGGDRSVEGYDVKDGKVAFVSMDGAHLEELCLSEKKERVLTSLNDGVYNELRVLTPMHVVFKASDGEKVEGWVLLPSSKGRVRQSCMSTADPRPPSATPTCTSSKHSQALDTRSSTSTPGGATGTQRSSPTSGAGTARETSTT
jgi:dipeptidyl aminopeptidase/acylaminoacyl peptidase